METVYNSTRSTENDNWLASSNLFVQWKIWHNGVDMYFNLTSLASISKPLQKLLCVLETGFYMIHLSPLKSMSWILSTEQPMKFSNTDSFFKTLKNVLLFIQIVITLFKIQIID